MEDELTGNQQQISKVPKQLQPHVYKKGQSGNPSGRPEGISMKEYLKKKFRTMTDEEREEYLEGIDKLDIVKLAEGNPETKTDITSGGKPIIQVPSEIATKHEITPSPINDSEKQ